MAAPRLLGVMLCALLASCGESARLPAAAGVGLAPTLPAPQTTLVPTVNIAPAVGWAAGEQPQAAPGLQVRAFAQGLSHPRWLLVLPDGDVLVAEADAPPRAGVPEGVVARLRGWVMGLVMARAGAGKASANRITRLRDADGDGVAETRHTLLEGLNSPFGMALVGDSLYVANTDAVLRFPYRAGIWRLDLASGQLLPHASGLRNPNGLAIEPRSGVLWTVVNERDELGSDLVPDYLTAAPEGAFFGWPWSYYGTHVDARVQPPNPEAVARARVPDYALGAHVAPLGLAWSQGVALAAPLAEGMFVGLHGSWNRRPRSGYEVVFVPFAAGRPTGAAPVVVLAGFVDDDGRARGRPVGVAVDGRGALLVADDVGGTVWRVTAATR